MYIYILYISREVLGQKTKTSQKYFHTHYLQRYIQNLYKIIENASARAVLLAVSANGII